MSTRACRASASRLRSEPRRKRQQPGVPHGRARTRRDGAEAPFGARRCSGSGGVRRGGSRASVLPRFLSRATRAQQGATRRRRECRGGAAVRSAAVRGGGGGGSGLPGAHYISVHAPQYRRAPSIRPTPRRRRHSAAAMQAGCTAAWKREGGAVGLWARASLRSPTRRRWQHALRGARCSCEALQGVDERAARCGLCGRWAPQLWARTPHSQPRTHAVSASAPEKQW